MLSLAVLIQPVVLTGCGTPTNKVNQVVGSVTIPVDQSLQAWGVWVRAGRAPVEDRIKVRAAYIKYQHAMQTAEVAAISALNAPTNQPAYITALNAATAAGAELSALIQTLTQE